MCHRRMIALVAILLLAPLAADAAPRAYSGGGPGHRFMLFSWSWLRAPFAWLAHSEPEPKAPCQGPTCFALAKTHGFQVLACDAPDFGTGLYVDLDGSVQFRSAEIVFEGGEVDRLDLQYATRTDGIFELRDFGRERTVRSVLLIARAASPAATMRIRFGRAME
jgi:hypothetical protein